MLIFSFHNEIEEKMFLGIYFKLILSSSCLFNKLQKEHSRSFIQLGLPKKQV